MALFWQEDDKQKEFVVPDDILDVSLRLTGRAIPVDHAYALSRAILAELPWMADEAAAGVHQIHVAASGNGWMRPEGGDGDALIYMSRRTRLTLRVPKNRVPDCEALRGKVLNLNGHEVEVSGGVEIKPLSALTTIFSRYVLAQSGESEDDFLHRIVATLADERDIRVRKILCGRETRFAAADGPCSARSVMLAEIDKEESVRLQQHGLGAGRLMGFGLFIPHKGIAPVKGAADE
ncbi:MAG: type I-MYXAN CRISPR-associated protein Cas6/Cmx6 [Gammaproteobacteria bacterium]